MKHVTPFRIAAVLLAIFCVLHTAGGMLGQKSMGPASDAVCRLGGGRGDVPQGARAAHGARAVPARRVRAGTSTSAAARAVARTVVIPGSWRPLSKVQHEAVDHGHPAADLLPRHPSHHGHPPAQSRRPARDGAADSSPQRPVHRHQGLRTAGREWACPVWWTVRMSRAERSHTCNSLFPKQVAQLSSPAQGLVTLRSSSEAYRRSRSNARIR